MQLRNITNIPPNYFKTLFPFRFQHILFCPVAPKSIAICILMPDHSRLRPRFCLCMYIIGYVELSIYPNLFQQLIVLLLFHSPTLHRILIYAGALSPSVISGNLLCIHPPTFRPPASISVNVCAVYAYHYASSIYAHFGHSASSHMCLC